MKKLVIILFIFCLCTPSFATGLWYEGCEKDTVLYDISEVQDYAKQLEDKFYKKYASGTDLNGENYSNEVVIPLSLFMAEQQRRCEQTGYRESYCKGFLQ